MLFDVLVAVLASIGDLLWNKSSDLNALVWHSDSLILEQGLEEVLDIGLVEELMYTF